MEIDELLKQLKSLVETNEKKTSSLDYLNEKVDDSSLYPTKENGFFIKEVTQTGKVKESPDYDGLATYMKSEYNLKCDDSLIYIWTGKHYELISFLKLKNIIDSIIKIGSNPTTVNNFFNKTLIKGYKDFESDLQESGYLNCDNGLLNLKTKELLKHSPEFFFKYKLNHKYDKKAKCPLWLKVLDRVTNEDEPLKKLLQQVFGYCIVGGYPKAHKSFMFYGGGGNGKSTIITALRNLVGHKNASHVPLPHFDKPFSMISLDGKLVNLIDETPTFNINAEAFKNVVSGGYVRAAQKGKPEFDLQVTARIIFACNELPNFKDASEGLKRRLVIIPFNYIVNEDKKDTSIDDKLCAEMSGILNWSLQGLEELRLNGFRFIEPKESAKAMIDYLKETDSVYNFWENEIDLHDGPNNSETFFRNEDIYFYYKRFCEDEGLRPFSKQKFCKRSWRPYSTKIAALKTENHDKKTSDYSRRHKKFGRGFRFVAKRNVNQDTNC